MSFRIKEILVVSCLAAFIFFINTMENYTDVALERIIAEVGETAGLEEMTEFDGSQIRRNFGINANDYREFAYYGHESVMDSESFLIIKLYEAKQGDGVISAIKASRDKSMELFKSYAPEQYALLSGSIIEQKGNYVIYVVSDRAAQIERAVTDILTGEE